jgi:hypothetical protein
MAARIQLNKFVRKSQQLDGDNRNLYTVPSHRAGIIISALCTNTDTSNPVTVNAGLSGLYNNNVIDSSPYPILQGFQIAPADSVNIVINKLVLNEYDTFYASTEPGVNSVYITLSILETRNDQ